MQTPNPSHARFNELFQAESDAIFRLSLFRVSNREQALDIVQEAFLRLWRKMSDGTDVMNPRAFLFKVSHNLIIDWYRKKKAGRFDPFQEDSGEVDEPADQATVHQELELGAEGRYLIESIGKLSRMYKRAVYLKYVEGLAPAEIGKALRISPNSASVRVHRGLCELRELTGYDLPGEKNLKGSSSYARLKPRTS